MSANTAVAGQRITAAWLNLNIPGPWQAITPAAGFANAGGGQVTFQARQYNSVTAEVIGALTYTAGVLSGAVLGTMPPGLIPSSTQPNAGITDLTSNGVAVQINVLSGTGQIKAWCQSATATGLAFNFFVSLDA